MAKVNTIVLMQRKFLYPLIAILVIVAVVKIWRHELSIPPQAGDVLPADGSLSKPLRVLDVLDGDTIVVDLNGNGYADNKSEQVQLLGVDAEEMREPASHAAHLAKTFVESLLSGLHVRLSRGAKRLDVYGRTLAFVYIQGSGKTVLLNEAIIQEGYARFFRRYEHELPEDKRERFANAEAIAQRATQRPASKTKKSTVNDFVLPVDGTLSSPRIVLNVIDGDTIVVDLNGNGRWDDKWEEIRLLGVDADEITGEHPNRALDAKNYIGKRVLGQSVRLAGGLTKRDRYNRTLAFVYYAGAGLTPVCLNEGIIRDGYARLYRRFAAKLPLGKKALLEQAEAKAKKGRHGPLWSR